jgi:hypothetical protein
VANSWEDSNKSSDFITGYPPPSSNLVHLSPPNSSMAWCLGTETTLFFIITSLIIREVCLRYIYIYIYNFELGAGIEQ